MILDENLFEDVDLATQQSKKMVDVEAKAEETQNPVYADATRQMKKTAKVKDETVKVEAEPKHEEKPKKPKMATGAKKLKLESLLEDLPPDIIDDVWKQYVPRSGMSKTIGGEIARAFYGMAHAFFQNGDTLSNQWRMNNWNILNRADYIYAMSKDAAVQTAIRNLESGRGSYEARLKRLQDAICNMYRNNPDIIEQENTIDCTQYEYTAPTNESMKMKLDESLFDEDEIDEAKAEELRDELNDLFFQLPEKFTNKVNEIDYDCWNYDDWYFNCCGKSDARFISYWLDDAGIYNTVECSDNSSSVSFESDDINAIISLIKSELPKLHEDVAPTEEKVTVELDFDIAVDDEEFDEVIKDICDEYHLTYEITQAEGPGGGWPVVKFTGTKSNVINYLRYYSDDEETPAEELLDIYSIKIEEGLYQAQEVFTDEENKTFAKSELGMVDKDKLSDEDRRMIARRKLGLDKKKVYIDPKDSWTPEERRAYAKKQLGLTENVLKEAGEWIDDDDDIAWKEHLLDLITKYTDITLTIDDIKGFDKYQGPYAYDSGLEFWTDPDDEYSLLMHDYSYSGQPAWYIISSRKQFDDFKNNNLPPIKD